MTFPAPDFRLLFESAPGLYLVLAPDFQIVGASEAYLRATMTTREQILGRKLFDVFPDNPDDPAATGVRNLRASLERVLETRQPHTMAVQKYDIRRPAEEGGGYEERFWSPVNSPVLDAGGHLVHIIHRVEDVTDFIHLREAGHERAQMAEALRTRTEQMEAEIYQRAQAVAEANRQLTAANEHLANLYREIARLLAGTGDGAAEPAAEPGRDQGESGAASIAPAFIPPEEMLARVGDLIARHRRLQDDLRQAQKIEAIGQLAGGVAHDFNNLLTVILGHCSLLLARTPESDRNHQRLREIMQAGERAAALTRQLLAFGRKQVLQPVVVDLASTLQETGRMLRRVIGEHIEMETAIAPHAGHVKIDPTQLQQVILNLAVNARDAMPHGGTLKLEIGNESVDESRAARYGLPAADYVALTVQDNGSGMESHVRERIFEPFFTTKEPGVGTGMGLATVYGIVRQSGGHIWVDSEPGRGSTFKVFLPRFDEPPEPVPEPRADGITGGNETILVVEDDAGVRALVEETLCSTGYRVLAAGGGQEAFRISDEFPGRIDLLLTDVIMPELSGKAVADELLTRRPGLMVVFMSGYTGSALLQEGSLESGAQLIQKPFTPSALRARVRSVLDRPPALRRVLVVDDEPAIRKLLSGMLEEAGFQAFTAPDGAEARRQIERHGVQVALIDLVMPGEEGIALIRALRKQHRALRIVAMSGTFGPDILAAAGYLGADATLSKPLTADALLGCIGGLA